MKKYLLALACFGLLSCDQIQKIDKQMDADSTDIANEISDLTTGTLQALDKLSEEGKSELIFVARGSESGWVAEYYNDKFKLVTDYGKDSLIIKNISKHFDLKDGYSFSYKNTEAGKEVRLNVKIEDKACVDEATAEKKSKTVTITYNDKVYKGCGEEVK
ncbi:MAG TPA: hypothetical protein VN026_16250 [Bacteroidia bacterium]|jgi:hypothetical protein|nr:hypothetical protein [Bacteroidia bacterium]